MQLIDLDHGEKFKFHNDIWTKLRCVAKYNNDYGRERRIFDCMNSEGRHRPFNDNTEVEPCQMRLEVESYQKREQQYSFGKTSTYNRSEDAIKLRHPFGNENI